VSGGRAGGLEFDDSVQNESIGTFRVVFQDFPRRNPRANRDSGVARLSGRTALPSCRGTLHGWSLPSNPSTMRRTPTACRGVPFARTRPGLRQTLESSDPQMNRDAWIRPGLKWTAIVYRAVSGLRSQRDSCGIGSRAALLR
jgi:hypothetical protein